MVDLNGLISVIFIMVTGFLAVVWLTVTVMLRFAHIDAGQKMQIRRVVYVIIGGTFALSLLCLLVYGIYTENPSKSKDREYIDEAAKQFYKKFGK